MVITMLAGIGIALIVAGIVIALWGNVVVAEDRGIVSRMVRWPDGRAKWLRVVIGVALVYAGMMLLVR